jgi:hypothetical protein
LGAGVVGLDAPSVQIGHHAFVGRVRIVLVMLAFSLASGACSGSSSATRATSTTPTTVAGTTASTTASTAAETTPSLVSVSVVTVVPERAASCATAARSGDAGALLSAFRAARVRGQGAEGCVTERALGAFCRAASPCSGEAFKSAPGPICLYECDGYRVTTIDIDGVSKDEHGNLSAYLIEHLRNQHGETRQYNESLALGRGVPTGQRTERPMVVVDGTSSA